MKSKIYPPSKAGMGKRFISPRLIDKIAIKKIIENKPLSRLVPEIFAIPIGPNTSFLLTSNINNDFIPFNHSIVIFMESKTPNFKAGKRDNVFNSAGEAVTPILPIILFDFFS